MYVITFPRCASLAVVTNGMIFEVRNFGPTFSNHVRSIVWLAIFWPRVRAILGRSRWIIDGKKPSMFEKWWGVSSGVVLCWWVVSLTSSKATRNPRMVTARAANFRERGIVITGVFNGVAMEVISRPARMLPAASRLMGLHWAGLDSLIGGRG